MNEIARYTFHVNSDKRSSGTNTDMTLSLKNTLTLKSVNSSFYMDVHSANIPFSFYQLSSEINTLQCVFTDTFGIPKTVNVSLQIGNYTTVSVLDQLSSKLIAEAQVPGLGYTPFTPVLNFSYSTTTAKSTYIMTGPANASIQMNFSTNQVLGTFFGFTTNKFISSAISVVSTNTCVANPVNYLLIRSGNLIQSSNREYIIESDVFSDILYRVPVGTSQNTWLQHLADTDPVQIANDKITSINIYLTTNLTYTPIDLQGVNWAISFSIIEKENVVYKPLTDLLVSNLPPPAIDQPKANMSPEEVAKLEKEYNDNLTKIEEYKKRLEDRLLKVK
jgi:hypothetical protein